MSRSSGAQERLLALALVVVGGGLALLASVPTWVSASVQDEGLPIVTSQVSGRSVAPLVAACGLLALAGGFAALLAGPWARRVIGLLLFVVGVAAAWSVLAVLRDPEASTVGPLSDAVGLSAVTVTGAATSTWPVVAALACTLVTVGGGWMLLRSGGWSRSAARYEREPLDTRTSETQGRTGAPGSVPPSADEAGGTGLWDSLDRGEDPTI